MDSEDVEELATQTLLSIEDVEMCVTHLDFVKKRRQAGASKAATTRKQKSARQKSSDKVATAGNEFWCLCGGPESGNVIACDNPDCHIECFHFECVGLVDAPSGKWLCTQSYHCSEMLCCNVKFIFLQNLITRSKFCSDVVKENHYLIKVYFVPDQFSVNGFFLFWFVCLLLFF